MESIRRKSFSHQSDSLNPDLKHLRNARVIQSRLVYIINIPSSIAEEEVLKSYDYLGQYGTITKLVLTKSACGSFGVYVTFARDEEAALCIKACQQFEIRGHVLSATYGTTKYCSFFISGKPCPKPNCLFLHKLESEKNTLTREGIPVHQHIQPEDAVIDKLPVQIITNGPTVFPGVRIRRERIGSEQIFHTPNKRRRLFSIEDSRVAIEEGPNYYQELYHSFSPSKGLEDVNLFQIEQLLSPECPDKWAKDVLDLRPRTFSEVCSTRTSEDDDILLLKYCPK